MKESNILAGNVAKNFLSKDILLDIISLTWKDQ